MIVQIPLVNSFLILNVVSWFEIVVFVIFVFSRASVISYVTSLETGLLFSSRIILNVASSPGL